MNVLEMSTYVEPSSDTIEDAMEEIQKLKPDKKEKTNYYDDFTDDDWDDMGNNY